MDFTTQQWINEVGLRLLPHRDEIASEANARIATELPGYTQLMPADDLDQSGRVIVGSVLNGLAGHPLERDAVAASFERGRRRQTQGVALEDMLRAVRMDFWAIWSRLVKEAARTPDPAEVSALAMLQVWEHLDELMVSLTDGYRYQETLLDRKLLERKAHAFASLASTPDPDAATVSMVMEVLGFPVNATYLVTAGRLGAGSDYRLAMRWRSLGLASHVATLGEDVVGITIWSNLGHRVLKELVAENPDRSAVLAPAAVGIRGLHGAVTVARIALRGAPRGVVSQSHSLFIETLLASNSLISAMLPQAVLGKLLALPANDRRRLLETLEGWVATDGGSADIALHLNRHRNTVINHLRRVNELTGLSLTTPADIATLVAAMKARRLLGDEIS